MKRPELRQFQDRVAPKWFGEWIAQHGNMAEGRVRSLAETASIMNASGRYERQMTASEVLRIERRALLKLKVRLAPLVKS